LETLVVLGLSGCTSIGSQRLLIWFPSNFTRSNGPLAPTIVPSLPSQITRLPLSRSSPCRVQISLIVIVLPADMSDWWILAGAWMKCPSEIRSSM